MAKPKSPSEIRARPTNLMVLSDATGFYIGTLRHAPDGSVAAGTRESMESWASPQEAEAALESGRWTQVDDPDLNARLAASPHVVVLPGDDRIH